MFSIAFKNNKHCASLGSFEDLTNAANSSWIQLKVRWTVAGVAAGGVDTIPADARGGVQTFVNI